MPILNTLQKGCSHASLTVNINYKARPVYDRCTPEKKVYIEKDGLLAATS